MLELTSKQIEEFLTNGESLIDIEGSRFKIHGMKITLFVYPEEAMKHVMVHVVPEDENEIKKEALKNI